MTHELPSDDVGGGPTDESGRAVAAAEPYAKFGEWIDRELDKLVARWSHWAAPNANRPRRKGTRQLL